MQASSLSRWNRVWMLGEDLSERDCKTCAFELTVRKTVHSHKPLFCLRLCDTYFQNQWIHLHLFSGLVYEITESVWELMDVEAPDGFKEMLHQTWTLVGQPSVCACVWVCVDEEPGAQCLIGTSTVDQMLDLWTFQARNCLLCSCRRSMVILL